MQHQAAVQVYDLPVDVDGATNAMVTDEFFAHMKACEELMLNIAPDQTRRFSDHLETLAKKYGVHQKVWIRAPDAKRQRISAV